MKKLLNKIKSLSIGITIKTSSIDKLNKLLEKRGVWIVGIILSLVSAFFFYYYLKNELGLAYNDARSHLDIGRRVVEGLKPGIAQLGSVWLPLNHILMIPLVWSDWAWHSGFAGAFWNMISFVGTGVLVYKFLEKLNVGKIARFFGVLVFAANLNILYLQSTAMTEPLLLFTMLGGCYYLMLWAKGKNILDLVKSSVWIMLSTLIRYDGWFLLAFAAFIVLFITWKNKGYKVAEGLVILFSTMAAFGIFLWLFWNLAIFKDPLYFILGPFSARAQQQVLLDAGNLPTKGNILLSTQIFLYSVLYNSIATTGIVGLLAFLYLFFDKREKFDIRFSTLSLLSPLFFNIAALTAGFSVIFVQGISGNTWFNIRYGIMLLPSLAIFLGFMVDRIKSIRWVTILVYLFITFFAFANNDAVAIDDARVGSSQKNVSEVAGFLEKNAKDKPGFILISAASHDAIIFSSNLPMKKFIHEGTGLYWESALATPDRWARWIVMRTYDLADLTYKGVYEKAGFIDHYHLVDSYPFADVYELNEEYLPNLNTTPTYGRQK
ncbi:hypothetical protein ACFL1Q_01435 [Patescibacteria group bacterium]